MNIFEKQPSEKFRITFDFSNSLSSETISSYTVTALNGSTNVNSTIIDTSSNTTTSVYVTVKAGTNGIDYKITVVATTNLGNVYEIDAVMKVRNDEY